LRLVQVGAVRLVPIVGVLSYVITYDIAEDRRREEVAALLLGYGPRVQLSVSGCRLRTRREAGSLQGRLRDLIDPLEDQVCGCPLNDRVTGGVAVIGARMAGERQDFWIIT
jgi:CRISPR-associated protein Cas2